MAKVKTNFKTARKTYFKEWRKFRGLTQTRLGERIDVTAGAISQLERGETAYTQGMLEALSKALQCEPADLLTVNPLINSEVIDITYLIRKLSEDDQKTALGFIEMMANKK